MISEETKTYIQSIKLAHYVHTRSVANISGFPIDLTRVLIANTLAGNKTLVFGRPSSGKSQLMWDMIYALVGPDNALTVREELYRGDLKTLFRYIDRNAYQKTGRSDEAIQHKNLDNPLVGIEEITRSGALQNSLLAVVDGEVYDDATGILYRIGKDIGNGEKFHAAWATGNPPNGETDFTSPVGEALATRFHLFVDVDDMPRTGRDDTDIYLQKRGPQIAFGTKENHEAQNIRLEKLLNAHREIIGLNPEADIVEDAVLKYFTFGLDHCQKNRGGEAAIVPHSKRGMKKRWPAMCDTCPVYDSLKYSCGAVMPAEPRHVMAWIRLRNALEAVAVANGAEVSPEDRVPNLLEAIKLASHYTLEWNPKLLNSDSCMGNNGSAARLMVKEFQKLWNGDVRNAFMLEALNLGNIYDSQARKDVGLDSADDKERLLPGLNPAFSYLRELLDDYNDRLQRGKL